MLPLSLLRRADEGSLQRSHASEGGPPRIGKASVEQTSTVRHCWGTCGIDIGVGGAENGVVGVCIGKVGKWLVGVAGVCGIGKLGYVGAAGIA